LASIPLPLSLPNLPPHSLATIADIEAEINDGQSEMQLSPVTQGIAEGFHPSTSQQTMHIQTQIISGPEDLPVDGQGESFSREMV
jgi:hypothetical protein